MALSAGQSTPQPLRGPAAAPWPDEWLSHPRSVTFPTSDDGETHGLYYPPVNPDYQPREGERPPLLVKCHGGPTGAASTAFEPRIQFWTSRGIAVLDVNYRGSTGYGRAYRRLLYGQWGVYDVDDCAAGAHYLAGQGLVDPSRLLISGSSAGGYTVLCALTFRDVFAAGASYYGVANLAGLAQNTHKFESRYTDQLVGPWPQARALYEARSPLAHADRLSCPVLFLQGLQDKVVPPAQAEVMVAALDEKAVPHAYITFENEQHGFRDAANMERALNAELAFYARVLGFTPADDLPALALRHGQNLA
jgi:dipeptidyl aminopeptidase/acylaminoacyl peptidase